jgi:hypothetical protein
MKPLGPGKARTELADGLIELQRFDSEDPAKPALTATQVAAVLGGAIEEALYEVTGTRDKQQRALFWRYLNHNIFDLTRTLKASNLLDKVK